MSNNYITVQPTSGLNGTDCTQAEIFDPRIGHFNFFDYIEPPKPIVTYGGATISTAENVTVLSGPPKSGKSYLAERILSSLIRAEGHVVDCFGFETVRAAGHVVWIDTERSRHDVHRAGKRIWTDAGYSLLDTDNDRLKTFQTRHFRRFSPAQRRKYLLGIVEHYKPSILLLDGISDLLAEGANAEGESVSLVSDLLALSDTYGTCCFTILHTAKTTGTLRGHLGSELSRKCESELTISVKDSAHEIEFTQLRNAGAPTDRPGFKWDWEANEGKGGFVGCYLGLKGTKTPKTPKPERPITLNQTIDNLTDDQLLFIAKNVVGGISSDEIVEKIRIFLPTLIPNADTVDGKVGVLVSERAFRRIRSTQGLIKKQGKFYELISTPPLTL